MGKAASIELRSSSLEAIERARAMLAQASTFADVKAIEDVGEAMRALLARKAKGDEAHAEAWALVQEAVRRLGEMTRGLVQAKRGPRGKKPPPAGEIRSKTRQLEDLGVSSQHVSRAERVAALPRRDFELRVDAGKQAIRNGERPRPVSATSSAAGYDGDEYCTPGKYLAAARAVMGPIELDPASNVHAASVVGAERWHHKGDSGLEVPWVARSLWLNPPYSADLIDRFAAKLVEECCGRTDRRVEQAIALVNVASSARWWQGLLSASAGFVLFDHRVAFLLDGKPIRGNRYEQVAFYFGPRVEDFFDAFSQFGAPCRTAYESAPVAPASSARPPEPPSEAAGADAVPTRQETP